MSEKRRKTTDDRAELTARLELRISPEQRDRWVKLAEARGMTVAELIRAAVDHLEQCDDVVLLEIGRDIVDLVHERHPKRRK